MAVTVLCSMATRHILGEMAEHFLHGTGISADVQAMGGVEAAKRARTADHVDVVALARSAMEKLEAEGHVIAGSRVDFAESGIAIAIRAGVLVPSLRDGAAVRDAMLAARHVGYSTGPSGDYLQSLWQRWNIADVMAEQSVQAPAGVPVAKLVAEGLADIGFQQLSELLGQPGIVIAGPLPPDIQNMTIFSAAISSRTRRPDEARAFIASLASPSANATLTKYGMQPPR